MVPYLMGDETTIGGVDLNRIREQIEDRAGEAVAEAANQLEEKGFAVETKQGFGDPGQIICEEAKEHDVDSIILGRRGHTTVGELLLGSVSHYVVHHADRPVTLVPNSK
jgi:nucleotide-binding universal stress UspA family protein